MSRNGRQKRSNRQPSSMPKSASIAAQLAPFLSATPLDDTSDTLPNPSGPVPDPKICQHNANGTEVVDCKGHRTGVLTGDEIVRYGIIRDYDSSCLQVTSYDLRLGTGHMVYAAASKKWLAKWVSSTAPPNYGNPLYECDGSNLTIPGFGMALIQLRETIDLLTCMSDQEQPVMICGHFDLKLSRVSEGLISQQATQVEPGYQGKLFCYLFNQTGSDITLSYADITNSKIATIEFQYVSCLSQCDVRIRSQFIASLSKEHAKYSAPYCNPHGIDDVRYFDGVAGELGKLPKHGGLSAIKQRLVDAEEIARKGCAQAIKDAGESKAFAWNWVIRLAIGGPAIIITLLLFILQQDMRTKIVEVWNLIVTNRGEVTAVTTEANAARDILKKLRAEAQQAHDRAKTELDELDRQKTELLSSEKAGNAEKPVIGREITGRGGNQ